MLQRKANQSIGGGRKATKQGGMDPNTKIKKKKKKQTNTDSRKHALKAKQRNKRKQARRATCVRACADAALVFGAVYC